MTRSRSEVDGVEAQAVGKTAASTPLDADAEDGAFGEVLLGDDLLDFARGLFGQCHTHRFISCVREGTLRVDSGVPRLIIYHTVKSNHAPS